MFVDLLDAPKGARWAFTVAKQPLPSGPVVAGDAQEPARRPAADLRFDPGNRPWHQYRGLPELDPAGLNT